jgi:hypothetical protein
MTKNIRSTAKQNGIDNPTVRHEFLRSEIQALQVQRGNADFNYSGGDEDYQRAWDLLKKRLLETEKLIKEMKPQTSNANLNTLLEEADVEAITEVWEKKLTVPQRRDVAKALIRKIVILPAREDYRSRHGYDTDRVKIEWQWSANKDVVSYYPRNLVPKKGTRKKLADKKKADKQKAEKKKVKKK